MSARASGLVRFGGRVLVAALLIASTTALLRLDAAWRIDAWLYDAMLSHSPQRVDERIVLVAIDGHSLSELGRWPWPRGVHADLVDRLGQAGAHRIGLNVLFAEPAAHDPAGDARLAEAVARAGNVVLPVIAEPAGHGVPPIEVMPMPALIRAAAGLGHVDADIDRDGVARSAYLQAGLGRPHWPAFALALADADRSRLPGLRAPARDRPQPYQWMRDHHVMIPYAAQGGFGRLSYVDVLRGEVDPASLRGRWVLVGTTASGIDPGLRTPRTRDGGRLPAIEYHANLLNALLLDEAIVPATAAQRWGLSVVLVLLPLLLARQGSRWRGVWAATAIAVAAVLASSALLLSYGRVWFPPGAALAALTAAAAGWALLRLRRSQRQAHSDALTRLANRRMFDLILAREHRSARRSGRPLSLLAVDVDYFKHYNDRYGHLAGDEVLRRVADTILVHARRPRDLAARYGGDELVVILPATDPAAAGRIAHRIVAGVRALQIPHVDSAAARTVTASVGVATFDPGADPALPAGPADLVQHADAALYRAKRAGRDRHCGSDDG